MVLSDADINIKGLMCQLVCQPMLQWPADLLIKVWKQKKEKERRMDRITLV